MTDQPVIEHPVPGLEVERWCNGDVLVFTVTSRFNNEILDAWSALLKDYLERRQTTDRFTVLDVSQTAFLTFTSAASQRLKETAAAYPDATGRVAVIVPPLGVLQSIGEFFIQLNNNRLQPNLDIQLFNNRQAGLDWVIAGLDRS